MERIASAIAEIENASGSIAKTALLKKYADLPGFKEVLKFIYSPYIRTGIAKTKLLKGKHDIVWQGFESYKDILNYFMQYQTGSAMDVNAAWRFINAQQSNLTKDLVVSIVTKDLKIGVTETTLNKVYGSDFIPKIGVMLAEKYPEFKYKVSGPFIVTEKLDGHRRLLVKENGKVKFYTRSGLPDEGLVDVEEEAKYLPDNMVYDGEFLAKGTYADSIALRQATGSIMNRKGTRKGVDFNIFDLLPIEDFNKGKSFDGAINRKISLGALFEDKSILCLVETLAGSSKAPGLMQTFFNDMCILYTDVGPSIALQHIKPVPILGIACTEQEILDFATPIWKRKFEGVMLNTFNAPYEIKRTKELLKVKHTEEHRLAIVDTVEGEGKYTGMLGALIVNYKGYHVGVGSGFTDAQRQTIWELRDSMIGRIIEVDTFGESTDKAGYISLNCPIFKRFVEEVE
jgi:DNA ligase-1